MPKKRWEMISSFSQRMRSFIFCPRKVAAKYAAAVTSTTKFFSNVGAPVGVHGDPTVLGGDDPGDVETETRRVGHPPGGHEKDVAAHPAAICEVEADLPLISADLGQYGVQADVPLLAGYRGEAL